MRSISAATIALVMAAAACSGHPDDGTLVDPGPGIASLPGGKEGVRSGGVGTVIPGTLTIAKDGVTAIAADPDRDVVWLANLDAHTVTEVKLQRSDEPGRVAVDDDGRAYVALRRAGAIAVVDLVTGKVAGRHAVCPAPRGVAFDALRTELHVACATGELVSMSPGGTITRRLDLGRDLRDVAVDADRLLVTRFRSAELLRVSATGAIERVMNPKVSDGSAGLGAGFEPSVAWRMIGMSGGRAAVAHQRANPNPIAVGPQGYYSSADPCSGAIVHGTVSVLDPSAEEDPYGYNPPPVALPLMIGPSDVAVDANEQRMAVVSIGNSWGPSGTATPTSFAPTIDIPKLSIFPIGTWSQDCASGEPGIEGEPTSVAFDGKGRVIVLSREPAQLRIVGGAIIKLGGASRADTGLALFHMNSGFGIACASCHPEGGDDSRTWNFGEVGLRRTQSFGGGFLSTAPFHWSGDMPDFKSLMHEVFVSRMGGPSPNILQREVMEDYLDSLPSAAPKSANDASERGRGTFESAEAGCISCHSGPTLSNNKTYDVGTNGRFQVPPLRGVGARTPVMHDGCANTLFDRFDPAVRGTDRAVCGGDRHGSTAQLSQGEIADLVAYLETL